MTQSERRAESCIFGAKGGRFREEEVFGVGVLGFWGVWAGDGLGTVFFKKSGFGVVLVELNDPSASDFFLGVSMACFSQEMLDVLGLLEMHGG